MSDTQIEITPQELKTLPQDSYQLIDTRDDASIAYGMANGAIHIPQEAVVDRLTSEPELLKGRTAILYCARGILSAELASELNRCGIPSRTNCFSDAAERMNSTLLKLIAMVFVSFQLISPARSVLCALSCTGGR